MKDIDTLVDKYIKGELSGEELKSFEKRMKTDAELREEVKLMKGFQAYFFEEEKKKVKKELKKIAEKYKEEEVVAELEELSVEDKVVPLWKNKWLIGLAVAASIAALVYIAYPGAGTQGDLQQYYVKVYGANEDGNYGFVPVVKDSFQIQVVILPGATLQYKRTSDTIYLKGEFEEKIKFFKEGEQSDIIKLQNGDAVYTLKLTDEFVELK